MEQSPVLSYEELGNVKDVAGYSVLRLSLSSKQATALQKAEEKISRYQLSEALNDNKGRSIFSALPVMASELWGIVRYPKLAPVRGLFLAGSVSKAQYEPSQNGTVLVLINLKEGAG